MKEMSSCFGKVLRAVERHVFDEVREAALVVVFKNRTGLHHEPELGSFFRFLVGSYVVAQAVLKLAHRDLRIDRHWLR